MIIKQIFAGNNIMKYIANNNISHNNKIFEAGSFIDPETDSFSEKDIQSLLDCKAISPEGEQPKAFDVNEALVEAEKKIETLFVEIEDYQADIKTLKASLEQSSKNYMELAEISSKTNEKYDELSVKHEAVLKENELLKSEIDIHNQAILDLTTELKIFREFAVLDLHSGKPRLLTEEELKGQPVEAAPADAVPVDIKEEKAPAPLGKGKGKK
jgi:predicted nuclease with TOPRIM domain